MVTPSQYNLIRLAGTGLSLGVGILYCASASGAISAVTFLATAILSNKVLDRVACMPMAKFTYRVIKGNTAFRLMKLNIAIARRDKTNQAKFIEEMLPYVLFAQLFLIKLSCLVAYYANQSLTSFVDAAITFTVKQLPSSANLQELFQVTLTNYPVALTTVMLVISITLLYINIKEIHKSNEFIKKHEET